MKPSQNHTIGEHLFSNLITKYHAFSKLENTSNMLFSGLRLELF